MSDTIQNKSQEHVQEHVNDKAEKKPYEKPAIVYRAALEAMAAVCVQPGGKSAGLGCSTTFS